MLGLPVSLALLTSNKPVYLTAVRLDYLRFNFVSVTALILLHSMGQGSSYVILVMSYQIEYKMTKEWTVYVKKTTDIKVRPVSMNMKIYPCYIVMDRMDI